MATFHSGASSAAASINDLDGYTWGNKDGFMNMNSTYVSAEQDEFGFDPPSMNSSYIKADQTYSPHESNGWPEYQEDDIPDMKHDIQQSYEIDRMIAQTLPQATNATSRFGQITPPRSDSAVSQDGVKMENTPRASGRKRTKTQPTDATAGPQKPGRKRKNAKKSATNGEQGDSPEESKRKASLEKNRVAAAKCRINKKEKTEQLQRDSHEKGLHNAFLKDQIMRMKSEVQHMHAILLAHASCEGCKSPEEIQKHLATIGQEYMASQMMSESFDHYSQMQLEEMPDAHSDDYFSSMSPEESSMMHPPLPEFNQSANFNITPMPID